MAGKLVQVATETVTSAVASVTLTGIDSDDVYMVAYSDIAPSTDTADLRIRVIKADGKVDQRELDFVRSYFVVPANTTLHSPSTCGLCGSSSVSALAWCLR